MTTFELKNTAAFRVAHAKYQLENPGCDVREFLSSDRRADCKWFATDEGWPGDWFRSFKAEEFEIALRTCINRYHLDETMATLPTVGSDLRGQLSEIDFTKFNGITLPPMLTFRNRVREVMLTNGNDWLKADETERSNILYAFVKGAFMDPFEEEKGKHPVYVMGRRLCEEIEREDITDI